MNVQFARHQMLCFVLWLSLIHTGRTQNHPVCIFISAIAETHKNAGNDAFGKHDFVKAINLYTEGIEEKCKDEDLNAKLYNNRASAHYHLGKVSFIYYIYSTHCQHCMLFRIQHSIVYSASLPFYVKTLPESQFNCLYWPYWCYQGEVLCPIIISWLCGRPC